LPGISGQQRAPQHQQRGLPEPPEGRRNRRCDGVLRRCDPRQRDIREHGNNRCGRQWHAELRRSPELRNRQAFLGAARSAELDARFGADPDVDASRTTDLDAGFGPHVDFNASRTTDLDAGLGPHVNFNASRTTDLHARWTAVKASTSITHGGNPSVVSA
jgi:hypothetical protein